MFYRSLAQIETRASAVSSFAPDTLDLDAGTVEVVLSTGAPVQRGSHIEVLAIGRENVEFAPRIPLLDSHRQTSIADIKGSVSNVRFEPGAIVATLNVSDPAALAAIARGDVTGVSVGYRVKKWSEGRDAKSGKRVRTATLFEIVEASLVAVPADVMAIMRSANMEDEVIETGPEIVSDPPENATRAETNAHTAPVEIVSGGVVIVGSIIGVANGDAANGAPVDVDTVGVFTLPKVAALAIAAGDVVYWDAAAKLVNKTASGNTKLGVATAAAANPSSSVTVRLNGAF